MKISISLTLQLLLSSAIGIYPPIKATISDLAFQEEEKTSAYTRSSYTHGIISVPDSTKINLVALKQGLLKMHEEAISVPYANTDVHNTCIAYWLRKYNLMLLQNEIKVIIDYTAVQRPVYFLLGLTGAGKSTAIFALQGNQVSRGQKEEESDDEDMNAELAEDNVKETGLICKTTVQVKNPKIGHSTEGETVGAIVYYPGDRTKNMAFCDTEGFSGERIDVSEAEKCISAFSPFFALKTNTIGGIVVVVSAHDILLGRGDMFKSSAHFLRAYFSAAGPQALRASLLLMITQYDNNKSKVTRALRDMIQKSYQAYFKVLEQVTKNNSHDNKKEQDTNTGDTGIAALQPFFKMLLEAPVCQGKEDEIKNFRFDNEKIFFFDPCSEGSIRKTWHKLSTLQTLHNSHLCCFDNPLSQYLRAQILEIGDKVKKKAASILRLQQRIKIQAAQLKAAKSKETLQPLIDQLQHEISTLNQENQAHRKDDKLICVFEEHHIEKLHLSRKGVVLDDTTREGTGAIVNAVANRQVVDKAAGGAVGGTIVGVAMGAGAVLGAGAGAVLGAVVAIGAGMWNRAKAIELAYREKTFSYSGAAPIYQMVATYENAELSHITPKESVVKEHFDIDQTVDEATIRYTATVKSTSLKKNKWEFKHVTGPFKDANCKVKMYAKKNELTSTRKLIADNLQKIKNKQTSIAACLQIKNDVVSLKHSYENDQQALQKLNSQFISEQKSTFDMLNTWARDIFRVDDQDLVLLKSYLSDFASAAELPLTIKQQTQKPLQPYQLAEGLDAMPSYNSESDQAVPLLPGQLLIPANGQCLYTTVIMGYLLPVKRELDKITARIDQLFGLQPADYINELSQKLENLTHYLTYLHSDAFSILVTAFMKRMQIKKGTWGGPHEIQTIATKLNVNIQVYYPDPNNRTNLVQSDLTKPAAANADITLHIVQDKVHPAEVRTQTQKASAEDNPHYQHYRLKYTRALRIN